MNSEPNPYASSTGGPIPGKESEFFEWESQAWKHHLATLSPSDRQQAIDSSLRVLHRMQSEQTGTPDFETWKSEKMAENKDLFS